MAFLLIVVAFFLQEQIAAKHGFEIIDHALVLYVRKNPDKKRR